MVRPSKAYFLVKIPKKEQKERIEKTGMFYNPVEVHMTRNMQSGTIVAIGEKAHDVFPEAKEGHILIFHHFVEGDSDSRKDSLVFEDEDYNYYVISSYQHNGKATEVYGVWDGEKIIPHSEYLFLEKQKPAIGVLPLDLFINQAMQQSNGGLFLFKSYVVTREDNLRKVEMLKAEVVNLAKSQMTPEIKAAMEGKEAEMAKINHEINKVTYAPYTIAYSNKIISEWFDRTVDSGDTIFCRNNASIEVEFLDKTYLVCETKYIGYMLSNN